MNMFFSGWLRLTVCLALCAACVIGVSGCRILGQGDQSEAISALDLHALEGNVFLPDGQANISASHADANLQPALRAANPAGTIPILNALVWIEGHPEFTPQRTNASGAYRFLNLPAGRYRVVIKFEQNGKTYKIRSEETEAATPGQTPVIVQHILELAQKLITGTLLGADGNPLPNGTVVQLWGESFPVNADGTFSAGPLPDGVTDADLTIRQPGQTLATALTLLVQLFSSDRATTIELQLGGAEQPKPMGAIITAKKNNNPISAANPVGPNDRVALSVTLINIDQAATGLTYEWEYGRGRFETAPGNTNAATWIAPSIPGIATISVKISAPNRGSCRVRLPITVGSAVDVTKFTVTFDAQGGSAVSAQSVDQGSLATKPADPTRAGFAFAGWNKNAAGTIPWDFNSDAVTAATTLYARWISDSATTWQVTFDSQGGSAVQAQTVVDGEKAVQPNAPTKGGFGFGGWYKEVGLATLWDFNVDTVTAATPLYAKWIALNGPTCTLTYLAGANGSISGTTPQVISQGTNGTAITAVPLSGYQFVKWSDDSTTNPRTDTNVTATMTVTATFAAIQGAIAGDNKYAWSENSGWINFAPTNGGVGAKRGAGGSLTGLAWSESVGWIKLAATGAVAPFANSAANNWGVNVAADGALSGYAWSENSGWINFGATGGNAVLDAATGNLTGFAWSESLGWIKFAGTGYKIQFGS